MNKKIGTELTVENLNLLVKKFTSTSIKYKEAIPLGCITNQFNCSTEQVLDFVEANQSQFKIIYSRIIYVTTPKLTELLISKSLNRPFYKRIIHVFQYTFY